ncbi:MAG: GNAT family N-acetyltransferase [Prevotellaceae bacterium]|jgi:diamine N-acetyltransferase|nr:GNAT family N-acetyltransferase [Prevotellaceae bacterium]
MPEKITLRAVEPEDLEFFYKYENSHSLWAFGQRREPFSKFALKEYINSCDKTVYERGQLRFMIVENGNNTTVGTIDLSDFDYHNQRAEVGLFIVEEFRNQGFAERALKLLVDYAFNFLHIHQLYAFVAKENQSSVNLFVKTGFDYSAELKDWFYHSKKYQTVVFFQKIFV